MSWRDRLQNASYRGFAFLTNSHDTKFGRRLVVHEFPGAELPKIEDFGAKAVEYHVDAYFIGTDYDLERNKFLLLLQQPGSALLVHPSLGRVKGHARDWSLTESNGEGGYCGIAIDFVPEGALVTQAKVDAADEARIKLENLSQAAPAAFPLSTMGLDDVNRFIADASVRFDRLTMVLSIARIPLNTLSNFTRAIQGIKNDFSGLLALPPVYITSLASVFDGLLGFEPGGDDAGIPVSAAVPAASDTVRIVSHVAGLARQYPINAALANGVVPATSPLELSVNLNKDMALHAVFLIAVAGQMALVGYDSVGQRDAVLAEIKDAFEFVLPLLPDAVFEVALDARKSVIEALLAQDIAATVQREVPEYMPATVLAYQLDVDGQVFVATNNVKHPLFVKGKIYG